MPKVSVIIAAYNAMSYLPQAVDSILGQTFQDFEIIIVDDGSKDNIKEWVNQLTDARIQFLSQENAGSAAARNAGISVSSGDYVALLDSDDLWEPDKLEKQVDVLELNPDAGLVYTWVAMIDAAGNKVGKVYQNFVEGDVWATLIERDLLVCGSTPLIRRECFTKVGLFDVQFAYAQTWEMWLRIAGAYPFKVIPEVLTYYRFHPNNTSKQWQKIESNYKKIIEKVFKNAPEQYRHLESRCYGHAYLRISWKMLQNQAGDCAAAKKFRKQALSYCPELITCEQCVRLTIALSIVGTLGINRYNQLRDTFQRWKSQIVGISKSVKMTSVG